VIWFAARAGYMPRDERLRGSILRFVIAGFVLAAVLWLSHAPVAGWVGNWHGLRDLATLGALTVIGAVVYVGIIVVLFGGRWLAAFRGKSHR
jgi:putative peptidoglycan lipid II flippase